MKKITKIILTVTSSILSLIFISTISFLFYYSNTKSEIITTQKLIYLIIFMIFTLMYIIWLILFFVKKDKYIFSILFLIFNISFIIINYPGFFIDIFGFDEQKLEFLLILLIVYLLLIFNIILIFMLTLKFKKTHLENINRKKLSQKAKNKVNNSNIKDLEKQANKLQAQLNSEEMPEIEDFEYFSEESIINAKPNKIVKKTEIFDEETPKENSENYEEFLTYLKKSKEKTVSNNNNISDVKQNTSLDNPTEEEKKIINQQIKREAEIAKIEIFLPRSNRYQNVDTKKLKEDIYYGYGQRNVIDSKKSIELQKKYANQIDLGDSDDIWNFTKQREKDYFKNNTSKSKSKTNEESINSTNLEDYFKYKEGKK